MAASASPDFSHISGTLIHETVAQYKVPASLLELDTTRYTILPIRLAERKKNGDAHLTKNEVALLVDWKLSHGTFRPSLKALVRQNDETTVETATRRAFETFDPDSPDAVKKSMTLLTALRGIGPATASLLLSVYDPAHAPFFSDELFRWSEWQPGAGNGWDRRIKYNMKEYLSLFDRVQSVLARLDDVSALDLERVAYVLGQQKHDAEEKNVEVETKPLEKKKRKAVPERSEARKSQRLSKPAKS